MAVPYHLTNLNTNETRNFSTLSAMLDAVSFPSSPSYIHWRLLKDDEDLPPEWPFDIEVGTDANVPDYPDGIFYIYPYSTGDRTLSTWARIRYWLINSLDVGAGTPPPGPPPPPLG